MRITFILFLVFSVCAGTSLTAQKNKSFTPKTTAASRAENVLLKQNMRQSSSLNGIEFRNVGPTIMSGRVTDIAVNPNDPTHFYVAYASGGLWLTRNNGTSFSPVGDNLPTLTIGDIDVTWSSPEQIWIGTGENNSSRSSYSGMGLYFSPDGGENWHYKGLEESHHIGRISVDPSESNNICVAVMGHLYTPNKERGIYISTDAGATWKQTLFVNNTTGAIDLVRDPLDPNHLFASTWDKSRAAWNFVEGGKGSGIWESTDNGQTWTRISSNSDFPEGPLCGRIGLSMYNGPKGMSLYAMVDNQELRPEEKEDKPDTVLTKLQFKDMSKMEFSKLDTAQLQTFLSSNNFDEKYTAEEVFRLVNDEEITPNALYTYLYDANANLFDTPVIGPEVYKYEAVFGEWKRTHEAYLDDVCYSYGYYFGMLRVHPKNPKKLYIAGVPIITSDDGGATWRSIQQDNVHADHHALWIDPLREGHLINGNDGGINISYDDGETYIKCNSPAVGQFYTVQVDEAEPYHIYGGLQDNGVWVGPSTYEASSEWHQSGHYPYEAIMGGDGMQVQVDTRNNQTVYTGYQFGNYYRINRETEEQLYIHPKHDLGEFPLRWNWQTPIHLSRHNQDVLYMASNRFHRSLDAGETWETLSEDLTNGPKEGDVPYGSCTSIDESPLQFGFVVIGTDDGRIWKSTDVGTSWKEIGKSLPNNYWVSRIECSNHQVNTIYATLNGYRTDDFTSLIYVSTNAGETWTRIGNDLPNEPINVVLEDPLVEDVLFVGTDNGLYASTNAGIHFEAFGDDIPNVAVHDLVMQQQVEDLVVGTHGRSIYVANMTYFHKVIAEDINALHLFELETVKHSESWGSSWSKWFDSWEPEIGLAVYSPVAQSGTISIKSGDLLVWNSDIELMKGINTIPYSLEIRKDQVEQFNAKQLESEAAGSSEADNGAYYLPPGNYEIVVSSNGKEETSTLVIE